MPGDGRVVNNTQNLLSIVATLAPTGLGEMTRLAQLKAYEVGCIREVA